MKKIILCFCLFFFFFNYSYANFQPIKSTIYLENKNTNEIRYFETTSYTMKGTWEISFINSINDTNIGDKNIFNNWYITQVCTFDDCFNKGNIKAGYFGTNVYDNNLVDNLYKNEELNIFNYKNLNLKENITILYKTIFWEHFLIYIFLLPLNLFIFYCVGYGIYFLFPKNYFKRPLLFIYVVSFLAYTIYYVYLFYFGYSLINFSTQWFGFMSFFFLNGLIKLILLFISKDIIKENQKIDYLKSNFLGYILYFYCVLFGIYFLVRLILNIFS